VNAPAAIVRGGKIIFIHRASVAAGAGVYDGRKWREALGGRWRASAFLQASRIAIVKKLSRRLSLRCGVFILVLKCY
jgi:hypothetical protein